MNKYHYSRMIAILRYKEGTICSFYIDINSTIWYYYIGDLNGY